MSKLILTRGVPASGKTTWAKAWVAEDPYARLRANRDEIRAMLGIPAVGDREQEQNVTLVQKKLVGIAADNSKEIVLDDTNLRARHVKEWLRFAASLGMEVEFKDFPINLESAQYFDRGRKLDGERFVGPEVIEGFFTRFHINKETGALPTVPTLDSEVSTEFAPYVETPGLSHCIIVDIDGTLAHMDDKRGPYDTSLYHVDRFDTVIGDLALTWGTKVFLLSGRSEEFRAATEKWLAANDWYKGVQYRDLYMRPAGDTRNDAIVKDELFEMHIAGRSNVDFILDDRDRVVKMWRAKGLKCLQVAEGSF